MRRLAENWCCGTALIVMSPGCVIAVAGVAVTSTVNDRTDGQLLAARPAG